MFGQLTPLRLILKIIIFLMCCLLFLSFPGTTQATSLGVHLLHPEEITAASELFANDLNEKPDALEFLSPSPVTHYVTIPFPLDEPQQAGASDKWQNFFNECQKHAVIPLIRLTTTFDLDQNVWAIPNRYQMVTAIDFLNSLTWPQPHKKHLIIFNEPNHHAEWGGQANPESYAYVFNFAANWAHATDPNFYVLQAGLDLAAPNGSTTMEAFTFLERMLAYDPQILERIDGWNSHSYPNPAFSSPPERKGQNSLYGYQHELEWLKNKIPEKNFPVYITETGWEENNRTRANLKRYYETAWEEIWHVDEQIVAVTPFLLKGAPGPFARFSLLDQDGNPTLQYEAVLNIVAKNRAERQLKLLEF